MKAPAALLQRIALGMEQALHEAKSDDRVPRDLRERMQEVWNSGREYGKAPSPDRKPRR